MELKHINPIPKNVAEKLNDYLEAHLNLQMDLYNYSNLADSLQFNGFSYWLQVQAQDEVLHQRKIMNYFFQRDIKYSINNVHFEDVNSIVKIKNAGEILIWLHKTKQEFLIKTHEIVEIAKQNHDFTTAHFMDWFLEDLSEEVDELKVLFDEFIIANGDHYKWDHHLGKREEPPTLKVIVPFYDPQ